MKAILKQFKRMAIPFVLLMIFSRIFLAPVWDDNQDATGVRYFIMMALNCALAAVWYPLCFSMHTLVLELMKPKRKKK